MNKHLIVLGIVILLICVGLSGCEEKTYTDSTAEITTNMLNSLGNIKSYSYSTIGSIIFNDVKTGITEGYTEMDIANSRLMMIQNVSMSMYGNATSYIYIINSIEYTNKTESLGHIELTKKNITEEIWSTYDNHELTGELLEISEVERVDDESVNDVVCYVITIIPDMEKYFQVLDNPMGTSSDYTLNNIEIKYWIDKVNYLPRRSYSKIGMNMSSPAWGDMVYIYETDIFYSNYNTDFVIGVPEWAINASWI